ncbi:6-phosphogluconolactonase [Sulfuriferula thiophila]|uniref:6-phosphogluconolactonase n=1 Tax=Sulfuriferula thiophila TaxID=1781211 RepID=UPI001CB92187|nr:6-phosphogluconolactonase [Sulfuriferula thiophila]
MNNKCAGSTRWLVTEKVVDDALRLVMSAAEQSLRDRGAFHLVLAGGNTPRVLYEQIALQQSDWSGWHIWFGDERCLPLDDGERNSQMANTVWLHDSLIPTGQIHVMHAELGAVAAVADYEMQLRDVGEFDLVLLGLGEDGHTASLFPGQIDVHAVADVVAVSNAPKPPADRVSLSVRRLNNARRVLFLVTGAGKHNAVAAWRRGEAIPAAAICPTAGVDVLVEPVCLEGRYE